MANSEKQIDQIEKTIPARAAEVVREALESSLRAGNTIVVLSDGALYKIGPDAAKVKIKAVPVGVKIGKGTKFKIK